MPKTNFAINGFGRIGRTAFKVWWLYHRERINLRVINTSGSMGIGDWAHLLKYDSNYGTFSEEIKINREQSKDEVTDLNPVLGRLRLGNKEILVTAQKDPAKIPWADYQVETVLECTGAFTSKEKAELHLRSGAKQVIISAPGKGEGISNTVIGVKKIAGPIASNASCTTNCVAPVAAIMQAKFGIQKAMLTTVHAYTDDQNLHDNSHKDLRRARAAAINIVPTSTGAAVATTLVIPELKGLFDGLAIRVPVAVGSLSDLVFLLKKDVTIEEVNQVLIAESKKEHWQGILAVTTDPIVSSDIVGRRESSIVDLSLTNVVGGNLVKIVAWYDNEFGYCNRLVEQVV